MSSSVQSVHAEHASNLETQLSMHQLLNMMSAECERVFLSAKNLITDRRNGLRKRHVHC